MEIPNKILEQMPTAYGNAVKKLLKDVNSANNVKRKFKIMKAFSKMYTTIPDIWLYWEKLKRENNHFLNDYNKKKEMEFRRQMFKHCYVENGINFMWYSWFIGNPRPILPCYRKLFTIPYFPDLEIKCNLHLTLNLSKIINEAIEFPHVKLQEMMQLQKYYSTSLLTKAQLLKYQSMVELSGEISDAIENGNDEIWLECLTKSEDEEFIWQNIEARLGENPFNVKLWKFYIGFLSSKNNIKVLEIYQRYCRLFIGEKDMRENYKIEIEKFNNSNINVAKWYIDLVKLELDFGAIKEAYKVLSDAINDITTPSKSLFKYATKFAKKYLKDDSCSFSDAIENAKNRVRHSKYFHVQIDDKPYFDPDSFNAITVTQNFAFQNPFIFYLRFNANFTTLKKLYQTCKYFWQKAQYLLIWNFQLRMESAIEYSTLDFLDDTLFAISDHPIVDKLKTIWIGNTLKIDGGTLLYRLSYLTPRLICKDIKYLDINRQRLRLKDIRKLAASKNIEVCQISHTEITKNNGSYAPIEMVFKRFPNAHTFSWNELQFLHNTPETSSKLALLKRNQKLKMFRFQFDEHFDPHTFLAFFKENVAPNACWFIRYLIPDEARRAEVERIFNEGLSQILSTWVPQSEKPAVGFYTLN